MKILNQIKLLKVKSIRRRITGELTSIIAGSLLFGASMNLFLLPGKIVLGGFTGIATLINIYTGFPVGIAIIILNVIPALVNVKYYGIRFLFKTICGILATSLAVDLSAFLPSTTTDPIVCAVLGGICMGAGCGLMFTRGYTTGGTDLIAWLLKVRFKHISIGTLIFVADTVVIFIAAIITRSFETLLYSAITIFTFSKAVDFTNAGLSAACLAYIFTENYTALSDRIINELERGVTLLTGSGGYTKEQRHIVMCAVDSREVLVLKRIVHDCDPSAFVIVTKAAEVLGDFKTESVRLN